MASGLPNVAFGVIAVVVVGPPPLVAFGVIAVVVVGPPPLVALGVIAVVVVGPPPRWPSVSSPSSVAPRDVALGVIAVGDVRGLVFLGHDVKSVLVRECCVTTNIR